MVPVGYVDIGLTIDKAAVGCAEGGRINSLRVKIVVGPLRLVRIVAEKSYGGIVTIEYGDSAFEFGHDGEVAMQTYLTGTTQMLRDGTDVIPVEIEVAKAAILAIAD